MIEFDTKPILDGLNDRQREAVQTTEGPVLVVAGPGSGKTRVLTCRIAWLLANQIARPYQVLALTFTNKAAREMHERVQKLLPTGMNKRMWVGTFHSMMARLLRVEAEHIGYTSDFTIYDTDDSERILKQLLEAYEYDLKVIKPRVIRNYISEAKNARHSADEMEKSAKSKQAKIAARLYDPYNAALSAANAFDFDDLLLKPLDLFDQYPEVLHKYQRKWSHLLIDEYQDTNRVQYLLAYALSERHRNLCVVGDDAQSIYSFRGADIRNIFSFEKDFKEAKVVRLEQNYRSTGTILNAADSVIYHNKEQIKKTLWTENGTGERITVIKAGDDREEAHRTVEVIRNEKSRSNLRYQDFAILYRTNAQSRTFEEALRRVGIPYRVIGGISFYQRKEIKDAIAYLRLLVNPNDISSFQRAVNYPTRGIGIKSQKNIIGYARQDGYNLSRAFDEIGYLPIPKRAQNALASFAELIGVHAAKAEAGGDPSEVATSLFQNVGLIKELELDETPSGQVRLENLHELLRGIQDHFFEDESHTLSSYLQEISLMTDADTDDANLDCVMLMTLHASKGLEFETVFVVGVEDGLLPLIRGEKIDQKDLEEERRLLYVGITRAKTRLYLAWARVRSRYGGRAEYSQPSRFLQEIDPTLLSRQSSASKRRRSYGQSNRSSWNQTGGVGHSSSGNGHYQTPKLKSSGSSTKKIRPQNPSDFKVGVRVRHDAYGLGQILVVEGQGDTTTVTVNFGKRGQKRLRVKFAPMRAIG